MAEGGVFVFFLMFIHEIYDFLLNILWYTIRISQFISRVFSITSIEHLDCFHLPFDRGKSCSKIHTSMYEGFQPLSCQGWCIIICKLQFLVGG